jgi:hypothetical protein
MVAEGRLRFLLSFPPYARLRGLYLNLVLATAKLYLVQPFDLCLSIVKSCFEMLGVEVDVIFSKSADEEVSDIVQCRIDELSRPFAPTRGNSRVIVSIPTADLYIRLTSGLLRSLLKVLRQQLPVLVKLVTGTIIDLDGHFLLLGVLGEQESAVVF